MTSEHAVAERVEHLSFPNESDAYREARNRLLDEEMALRRQVERVAAQRRALPLGGKVPQDYVFKKADAMGALVAVRMSELFESGKPSLAIYSFMLVPSASGRAPAVRICSTGSMAPHYTSDSVRASGWSRNRRCRA